MIFRFLRVLWATPLAVRAEQRAADEKPGEAFRLLRGAYRALGADMPSREVAVELNILLCQISISLEDGQMALNAAEVAVYQLEKMRPNFSRPDIAYLLAFSTALLNYCLRWIFGDEADELPNSIRNIPMNSVSDRLKHRYPMPRDGSFLDPKSA